GGGGGLLARTLIVDDVATAREVWPTVAPEAGVTLITRSGDVLTAYVLGGASGAKRRRIVLRGERDTATVCLDETVSL
ncbi:hypothetical protein QCD70_19160, partial [Agreia sp. PsM10]|uniref:hypothetical protein n=1 Tax=Agreia sp. PsM10 TaxID=3030533 RepID=UPI00263A6101